MVSRPCFTSKVSLLTCLLVAFAGGSGFLCSPMAAGGADGLPQPRQRPYVKLFTLVANGPLEEIGREETVRFIADNYGWINIHGGEWMKDVQPPEIFAGTSGPRDTGGRTVGDRLRTLNPGIILSNYRNGAYTSQNAIHEAMEVERDLPLAIAVHDTGARLAAPLSATDSIVRLRPPATVPDGKPGVYPFKASTTDDEHTTGKQSYVGWLRLGDEVLRIDRAERKGDVIELAVRRGIWGTRAVPHAAETLVLQPVYCGAIRPNGQEYYLAGLLDGNSPQRAVRYIMQQQHPAFWKFLAGKTELLLREGVEPWFDCATSSWINHANAYGVRLQAPYDLERKAPLDRTTFREYQQRKFDALFRLFPKSRIYVNWLFPQFWSEERVMFTGENGHRPVDGGAIEMYANPRHMEWLPLMKMQLDMRDRGIRVVAWAKQADAGDDASMPRDYQVYAYCTHLLVYEHEAPQYWGGAWKPRGPHGRFMPPDFVYWDLGSPQERFADIAAAELRDAPGVYCRRFDQGFVLVNPDATATREVALEGSYFDPESRAWTKRVKLSPRSGAILLRGSPPPPR